MHEVVRRGAHDEAFLRDRTVGWDALPRARSPSSRPSASPRSATCRWSGSSRSASGSRPRGRPRSAPRWASSATPAAGWRCARSPTIPAVTGDWALPGGGLAYSTSGYFSGDSAALVRDDLRPHPVRSLSMTRMGDVLLDADPPVHALVVYGANPLASNPDTGKVRRGARARGPVHRRDRAGADRHRRLRRHRAPVDDADGAHRRARRLRAHVPRLERARRRAARRVPPPHGDLPPARPRDGPQGAGALRRRPDARAHADRVAATRRSRA